MDDAVMDFCNSLRDTQLLDEVLWQQADVCWAIAIIRQLTALCRLHGLIESTQSLSIQYIINIIEKHLLRPSGAIYDLASTIPLLVEEGIVLDDLVPLTYKLDETNNIAPETLVTKIRVEDVVVHRLANYESSEAFEALIHPLIGVSPVAVAVTNYESFKNLVGDVIYRPTPQERGLGGVDFHTMVLSGAGVENGIAYWQLQESAGVGRGKNGYIRVAMNDRIITHFVEMKNPQKYVECFREKKVEKFIDLVSFDKVLYKLGVVCNKAHARILAHQCLITDIDRDVILRALDYIKRETEANRFRWGSHREDVGKDIEAALTDLIGVDLANKFHTACNKDDQVATIFRLWCRAAIDSILVKIKLLQEALVRLAFKNNALMVPVCTPLQKAQLLSLPHVLLAYVEKLERDVVRYVHCREGLNFSPLGACALAGGQPINRSMIANALDFTAPMSNSIDAIEDRDFILEFLFVNSNAAIHVSQLELAWLPWVLEEIGIMSSNDSPRVMGDMVIALTLSQGVPLASNRNVQEYKELIFSSTKRIMTMIDGCVAFSHKFTFSQDVINKSVPPRYLNDLSNCGTPLGSNCVGEQLHRWVEKLNITLEATPN